MEQFVNRYLTVIDGSAAQRCLSQCSALFPNDCIAQTYARARSPEIHKRITLEICVMWTRAHKIRRLLCYVIGYQRVVHPINNEHDAWTMWLVLYSKAIQCIARRSTDQPIDKRCSLLNTQPEIASINMNIIWMNSLTACFVWCWILPFYQVRSSMARIRAMHSFAMMMWQSFINKIAKSVLLLVELAYRNQSGVSSLLSRAVNSGFHRATAYGPN